MARGLVLAWVACLVMTCHAHAFGALAWSEVVHPLDAAAVGAKVKAPTEAEAIREAMRDCNDARREFEARGECKILATFTGQCFAVAMTSRAPGRGWGVATSKREAERAALSMC